MSDVQRLFTEYKEAHQASDGKFDPGALIEQVSDGDRVELIALIDAYLERAPRRAFSAEEFRRSAAAPVAEAVQRSLAGQAGLWPALLPRLRNRARIKRADLVAELAERLGAQGQRDKVAGYYHQMEQGLLPASGVSDSVLEALGRIVGYGAAALRQAGELPAGGGVRSSPEADAVFARTHDLATVADAGESEPAAEPEQWDEIDRLFRGG